MKRFLKILLIISGSLLLVILISYLIFNESLPSGQSGAEADALAQKMMTAINHQYWDSTGAVTWTSRSGFEHLWDRDRHFARVKWEDIEVLLNINRRDGIARQNGEVAPPEAAEAMIEKAWKMWVNDSFWLNPISKSFDPGTTREIIPSEGPHDQLLITFSSGGATPGDAYLWIIDDTGLPVAWKMWVAILPIGGLEITWENWVTLPTGVKISSMHRLGSLEITVSDIRGASSLAELVPGEDIFRELGGN